MSYIASKAIQLKPKDTRFEAVNFITGKSYLITDVVREVIEDFRECRELNDIFSKLCARNHSRESVEKLVDFLVRAELIIQQERDHTIHVVKHGKSIFNLGFTELQNLKAGTVAFLGIPYGNGNPTDSRCREFPNSYRDFSSNHVTMRSNLEHLRFETISNEVDFSNLKRHIETASLVDLGNIFMLTNEDNSLVSRKIVEIVQAIASRDSVPFILGGDHSITYPIVRALSERYPKFQILHFDAHFDYKESKVLELYMEFDHFMLNHASFINHCLGIEAVERIVQVGIRSLLNSPVSSTKLRTYWNDEIFLKMEDIKRDLLPDIPVYVTFDIDFLDPSIAPATATPIIGGATFNDLCKICKELLSNRQVIGVDLVEVNPYLDHGQLTNQLITYILYLFLNYIR